MCCWAALLSEVFKRESVSLSFPASGEACGLFLHLRSQQLCVEYSDTASLRPSCLVTSPSESVSSAPPSSTFKDPCWTQVDHPGQSPYLRCATLQPLFPCAM